MNFKIYIKNWGKNFKNYRIDPQFITDDMLQHISKCNICREPITLYTICQDKYLSQLFVQQLHWRTPILYFNGTRNTFTKEIYDMLPSNYVMKKTHGHSGKGCLPVKNNRIVNKYRNPSFRYLKNWFGDQYIICEEYLLDTITIKYPTDYKCYVFNGIIKFICIIQKDQKSASLYTIDFKSKYKYYSVKSNTVDIFPSPKSLETLKKYCSSLSIFKNLFVRVDFYIISDEVIFGEFTPNPNNGYLYSNNMLSLLDIEIKNMTN